MNRLTYGTDEARNRKRDERKKQLVDKLTRRVLVYCAGYGNICPRTKWGKVATIVYAIIGMPLFLLYLSNIGDILARSFKWTYARCCLCK